MRALWSSSPTRNEGGVRSIFRCVALYLNAMLHWSFFGRNECYGRIMRMFNEGSNHGERIEYRSLDGLDLTPAIITT